MSFDKVRGFVRARLWRHMFLWFGMTILASVITTSVISIFVHRYSNEPPHRHFGEAAQYVAYQAGQVWDDSAALHQVLQKANDSFQTGFIAQDTEHQVLATVGTCPFEGPPRHGLFDDMGRRGPGPGPGLFLPGFGHQGPPPFFGGERSVMVLHHDKPVGWLVMCATQPPPVPPMWRLALPLIVLVLMLGAATFRVAQGLTRPLADLVQVTQRIGAGQLASRVELQKRPPGEMGQLAQAINDMAAKIEKQISDQRTLLAMVSHELRTPLARMRLLVELARDKADVTQTLEELEVEVMGIDHIVGALLASARLEFSIVHRQSSDAEVIMRRALADCTPVPQLEIALAGDAAISGDITLLSRALANLVENAQKYGRGVAMARVRRAGSRVHFEIIDRGDGFVEDTKAVFDAFVRSPRAAILDPTSMGLGLTLVQRIAQAHGGDAYCENLSAGGACVGFSVAATLPQNGTPMPISNTGKGPNTYNG